MVQILKEKSFVVYNEKKKVGVLCKAKLVKDDYNYIVVQDDVEYYRSCNELFAVQKFNSI